MPVKVFVDFDGTITTADVGNAVFREFGGEACAGFIAEYHAGKISAQDCFRRECAAMRPFQPAELDALLARQEIDPGFSGFAAFCRERSIPAFIVSDGLDYYITRILERHGIRDIPFVANSAKLEPAGAEGLHRLALQFPYSDASCDRCAACKRNVVLTQAGDDDIIVYIGEGYSDRCPVQYADIVFAKKELQSFCQEENISYYLYDTFNDVTTRLRELLSRRTLRKRRRAELKRREAFSCEA